MECFSKIEMRFSLTQAKSFELKLINSRFMRSPSLMPSTKNLKNRYPIGIYYYNIQKHVLRVSDVCAVKPEEAISEMP